MTLLKPIPWLIFIFILDTGGWLNARLPVLLAFLLLMIVKNRINFNLRPTIAWVVMLAAIIPSLIVGSNYGVDILSALPYIYPILIFPILYIIFNSLRINEMDLVSAGFLFSILIVALFFGSLVGNSTVLSLLDFLANEPSAGFFKEKATFLNIPVQGIYFKATLLLTPIGLLAYTRRQWVAFFLILSALMIAQSKTGIFLLIFFCSLMDFKRMNLVRYLTLTVVALSTILLIFSIEALYEDILLGLVTRSLHFVSIYETFSNSWSGLFTGFGAGSTFYSYGFQEYTDDSEISQLEVLRRYGIVFLLIFCYFYIYGILRLLKNNNKPLAMALILFFVVSASNPVLLATPAIIFYAIVSCVIFKHSQVEKT